MHRCLTLLLLCLLCTGLLSLAQAEDASTPIVVSSQPAVLRFWNRDIIVLRAGARGMTPAERAKNAAQRLSELPVALDPAHVIAVPATFAGVEVAAVAADGPLFFVLPQDLDPDANLTVLAAAERAAENVRQALLARAQQEQPQLVLRGGLLALAATVVLALVLWAIARLRRFARRFATPAAPGAAVPGLGMELRRYIATAELTAINAATALAALVALYVWLVFVLKNFPYSAPWGEQLGGFLIGVVGGLVQDAVRAVPDLFTVAVIFVATRFVASLVSRTLERVQQGSLVLSWLDPDTARATRWVALAVIWLFAITVAYPYIPGSESAAFKGVSVFAGLMLTIGSSGFVSHVLSGLIVIYSKALRTGEMVKVGDTIGTVSEIGAFSTRILTGGGEEVNIPNTVLVGTSVHNYSRKAGTNGALLATTVTIGYDAPWRQVHAMLERAAQRTPGLRAEPKPHVLQRALSDFYVEYELRVHFERLDAWYTVQSELHANIQDTFNEFGVQIMSPHFVMQPQAPVVVPKPQWHAAPADGLTAFDEPRST